MAERINMRRALAGMELMQGATQKQALITAGYSPWTAAAPKRNGLNVEQCLAEAKKLDRTANPATILEESRRVFRRKLRRLLRSQKQLDAARPSEVARMTEVAEKFFGQHASGDEIDPRAFGSRLAWMEEALAEFKRRRAEPQDDVVKPERRKT